MASQEIIEKRIAILKLIKQELQKSETFLDIDNPPNDNIDYFIWAGTSDGLIGNTICHYEFIIFPKSSNNLTVEIHFEDKRFLKTFESIKYDKDFDFIDWDNGNHKRIIFRDSKISIDNPLIDNSKIVKKAMEDLNYLHKKVWKKLFKILQRDQISEIIKQNYLSKPKLAIGNGSIVRSKHYKPISKREFKELNTIHGAIQDYLCNDESNKKIYETIETEKQFIGLSYKIDILAKLKDEDKYDVFEVKSADTAEICIKEALGQLLFYKYLLEKGDYKINQLIIAGPSKITCIEEEYLNSLNNLIPELRYKYVPSIKY